MQTSSMVSFLESDIQHRDSPVTSPDSSQYHVRLVAHDLKTPLQCILLLAEQLNPTRPEVVGKIKDCVREMDSMIRNLNHPYKSTAEVAEHLSMTPLGSVIQDVLKVCPNGEKLEISGPSGELNLPIERQPLYHILQNLITNSIRHGGHRICICTGILNEEFFMDYSDDGPGIPEKVWKSILQTPYPTFSGEPVTGLKSLAGFLQSKNIRLQRLKTEQVSGVRIIIRRMQAT